MKVLLRRIFDGLERETIMIEDAQFMIGRGDACHLRPFCPLVSQHHCEIQIKNFQVTVRDLESRNGTYVNCQRVHGVRQLKSGDKLNVGLAIYEVLLLDESGKQRRDAFVIAAKSRQPVRHRWSIGLPVPIYAQSVEP